MPSPYIAMEEGRERTAGGRREGMTNVLCASNKAITYEVHAIVHDFLPAAVAASLIRAFVGSPVLVALASP